MHRLTHSLTDEQTRTQSASGLFLTMAETKKLLMCSIRISLVVRGISAQIET